MYQSLSARRAWIEIKSELHPLIASVVALRKESVDRNLVGCIDRTIDIMSLSARRAWIEIPAGCWRDSRRAVALRKESVDRNIGWLDLSSSQCVALRKESVDRNSCWLLA